MQFTDFFQALDLFLQENLVSFIISIGTIIIGYFAYKFLAKQIKNQVTQKRIELVVGLNIIRIMKWVVIILVTSAIATQFGVTLGTLSALITVLGGTIIGFAAINTIGNAIAGLIIMTNKPFVVGDRILFKENFVDVIDIQLVYTRIESLDSTIISIPNQELLKTEIENFGKKKIIRRSIRITPGFEYDSEVIENLLMEAASLTPNILAKPSPYVQITGIQSYAVEYTLFVYLNKIKEIPLIDSELKKTVLTTCKKHNIDISTPLLSKSVK